MPGGGGKGSRGRSAFWGPVLRTGAAPQSDGHKGTDPKINKNSPREPGLILTLSRGSEAGLESLRGRWMGCCRGGGGRAWGMSDGVSGRSVPASPRCRPLSGRRDMCGGPPLPLPAGIYGFVKAQRGAAARPAVGGFDVSPAAPAGFPPSAVEGKLGRAPRGRSDSGHQGRGRGLASFLLSAGP